MANNDRETSKPRDTNASPNSGEERRESGFEYGANETEQTRDRERAGHDRTDEIGEITETELP